MPKREDRFADPHKTNPTHKPVDYARWLVRLISWDGMVPLFVFGVPRLVHQFGPQNNDNAFVLVITLTVTAGILVRFFFGMRHIHENHCGTKLKIAQRIVLVSVIFMLCIFESVMAVLAQAPLALSDVVFVVVATAFYLLLMAFVLFPGRPPLSNATDNRFARNQAWGKRDDDSTHRFENVH